MWKPGVVRARAPRLVVRAPGIKGFESALDVGAQLLGHAWRERASRAQL